MTCGVLNSGRTDTEHVRTRPFSAVSEGLCPPVSFSHCAPSQCLSARRSRLRAVWERRTGSRGPRWTWDLLVRCLGTGAVCSPLVGRPIRVGSVQTFVCARRAQGPVDKCLPKTVWHGSSGMLLSGPHRPFPYPAGRDPCGILILRLHCEMSPPRHGHVFGFGWNDRSVHPRGFPSRPGVVGHQENRPIGRVPRVRFLGILRSPRSFARYDLHS